jgi:acyl-phosphate glycerol 3-phosphate acyltransferase
MPASVVVPLLWLACYLVGAIPFGYLVARAKGVDLFQVGSGNIGATNVGRVLGRTFGVLVFVLDFLKGALPVAVVVPLARLVSNDALTAFESPEVLKVGAAAFAFLGHLFPVYLGFRGGKGVATGAGAVAVLVPVPFLAALGTWLLAALVTRTVSLASILAVAVLSAVQIAATRPPFGGANLVVTAFCLAGSLLVVARHRANVGRLLAGTESQIGDGPMRQNLLRVLHVVAAGVWVGAAGFFNFVTAPSLFATFEQVVATAPSDRTANVPIVPPGTPDEVRKNLGSALAGAAVGPVFPKYFALQLACAVVVLATAWAWRAEPPVGRNRVRVQLAVAAVAAVAAGWWVSDVVSKLRLARFDATFEVAAVAREQFATWHLVSLGLSFVTILLAFALLVLAAWLPQRAEPTPAADPS